MTVWFLSNAGQQTASETRPMTNLRTPSQIAVLRLPSGLHASKHGMTFLSLLSSIILECDTWFRSGPRALGATIVPGGKAKFDVIKLAHPLHPTNTGGQNGSRERARTPQ